MKRRIFVAIKISEKLQKKIIAWQKIVMAQFPVAESIRWTKANNLHVTLLPPWSEENVADVIRRLKKVEGRFRTFTLRLQKIGLGPDQRTPRLVWAQGSTPKELTKIRKMLEKDLHRPAEKRPFRLHITLGRIPSDRNARTKINFFEEKINWIEEVESVALLESRLSPRGADYRTLSIIRL